MLKWLWVAVLFAQIVIVIVLRRSLSLDNCGYRSNYNGPRVSPSSMIQSTPFLSTPFGECALHKVVMPNGETVDDWLFVDETGCVNVLVYDALRGEVVFFRQSKYLLSGSFSLAPIGGLIEPSVGSGGSRESALETAKREADEEMGIQGGDWYDLGTYWGSVNRGEGIVGCFLVVVNEGVNVADGSTGNGKTNEGAEGAEGAEGTLPLDLEAQTVVRYSVKDAKSALLNGELKEIKWVGCSALAIMKIEDLF